LPAPLAGAEAEKGMDSKVFVELLLNPMQRLPKILFFTGVVSLAGILLAPFRDYAIEGTPDGKSLGIIFANDFRLALLAIISVLLFSLATFILLSKRFGPTQRVWAVATLSMTGVSWLLRVAGIR
jgi:hypothetical protein